MIATVSSIYAFSCEAGYKKAVTIIPYLSNDWFCFPLCPSVLKPHEMNMDKMLTIQAAALSLLLLPSSQQQQVLHEPVNVYQPLLVAAFPFEAAIGFNNVARTINEYM